MIAAVASCMAMPEALDSLENDGTQATALTFAMDKPSEYARRGSWKPMRRVLRIKSSGYQ